MAATSIIIAVVFFISMKILLSIIKKGAYTAIVALDVKVSKKSIKRCTLFNKVTIHNLKSKTFSALSKITGEYLIILTE